MFLANQNKVYNVFIFLFFFSWLARRKPVKPVVKPPRGKKHVISNASVFVVGLHEVYPTPTLCEETFIEEFVGCCY